MTIRKRSDGVLECPDCGRFWDNDEGVFQGDDCPGDDCPGKDKTKNFALVDVSLLIDVDVTQDGMVSDALTELLTAQMNKYISTSCLVHWILRKQSVIALPPTYDPDEDSFPKSE